MTLRSKIPSEKSLFVFETVARAKSFTGAAAELNVTQPAVSRTILALEKHVDEQLFHRTGKGLKLTGSGEILFSALGQSFQLIESALDEIVLVRNNHETITLSISTAMASHWLIPRFDDFRSAFPNAELRFHLMSGEPAGPVAPYDLGLRLGDHTDTEHTRWPFGPERVYAVASPAYIAKNGKLGDAGQKGNHTLLQLSNSRLSWRNFCQQTGQSLPQEFDTITVPDYSIILQSAIIGKGIALGFVTSTAKLLGDGLLQIASSKFLDTGRRYHLVFPSRQNIKPVVAQVRDWMIAEMAADLDRIKAFEVDKTTAKKEA